MPVTIKKTDGHYQVRTPNQVHAKATSLKNAMAQERILNAVEHNPNWKPTKGKKSTLSEKAVRDRAMAMRASKGKAKAKA